MWLLHLAVFLEDTNDFQICQERRFVLQGPMRTLTQKNEVSDTHGKVVVMVYFTPYEVYVQYHDVGGLWRGKGLGDGLPSF